MPQALKKDNTNTFDFNHITKKNGLRVGEITTPHGTIQTPAFIFCATKAAIKGLPIHLMKDLGTQIILSNTLHLMLKPGSKYIQKQGGLQKFTSWNGPMLTDSGGFQIFSLGLNGTESEIKCSNRKYMAESLKYVTSDGAKFKSYYDGKEFSLTPEFSIEIQRELGADLILVLDECMAFNEDRVLTRESMDVSHTWAERSLQEFQKYDDGSQKLYGIIHGGIFEDFRKESAQFANNKPYFGYAIGGTLGRNKTEMYEVVEMATIALDKNRPVHLLGVGTIKDIFKTLHLGIDTYDCVHPTRLARHNSALIKACNNPFNKKEHISLKNAIFKEDSNPIESDCVCPTCKNYTRSYLHHLIMVREPIVQSLLTIHNVYFMNKLMEDIRKAIIKDSLQTIESQYIFS